MLICTQTDVCARRLGAPEAIRLLARAGFDSYDISLFHIASDPVFADGWQEYAASLKAVSAEAGIRCTQAHAPFPTKKPETEANAPYNETIFSLVTRSMEAAAMLGAGVIVVHPIQHLPYWDNAKALFDENIAFYRDLAPYAKRFGIRVAIENMWQMRDGVIVDSTCATPAEFAAYLDALGDDCFTGCLDLGHCGLCGHDAAEMIRTLGADYIGALHIHDNDNKHDSHTMPYCAQMNWASILDALGEIGYRGEFTYEADNFLSRMPAEYLEDAEKYMCAIGRKMAAVIEAKKAARA